MDQFTLDDIYMRFTYHVTDADQIKLMAGLRDAARMLALEIGQNVPDSRERMIALQRLEEVMFWSSAAVSRKG